MRLPVQDVGWSDRPIYRHTRHQEYLFYLQSRNKGLWMIGPKVIHTRDALRNSTPIAGWSF